MKIIEKAKDIVRKKNEKIFLKRLRARLKNKDCTIVCNNCVGGVIYHNLGLKFNSPTINLYIPGRDYLEFVKNFEYYSHCDIVEDTEAQKDYPVGTIVPMDDEHMAIQVLFMHYDTFEEAKEKWFARYQRVNWSNIVYIWEFYDTRYDHELMVEYDNLENIRKILITHRKFDDLKNTAYVSCYTDDKPTARILHYNRISGKRFLDEFDYVKFLNESLPSNP